MHIRMQVRGSDKKRPQLAANCCMSSTRTTVTATLIRMPVRIRRKATEQGEKYHPAPPPSTHTPVQPYQTADRKEAQRLMRREILVSNPVLPAWWSAARGGMERTAGPADHSRSRRPIIMRGPRRVGARVVASGGELILYSLFFYFFFPTFHFLRVGLIKGHTRPAPSSDPASCS